MSRGTLKTMRFIIPAILCAVLFGLMSQMLGFTKFQIPTSFKDAIYNAPLVAIAVFYGYSPFRSLANGRFYDRVNENIRTQMVRISGLPDDLNRFRWDRVKDVFYRRVDSDESLKKRSEDIMANGLIWTSLADLTILSALFALASGIFWFLGFKGGAEATAVMALTSVASRLMQDVSTRRHIDLGNDQLKYIAQYQHDAVKQEMAAL